MSTSFCPAVGQGAITIEARADDARTRELLAKIDHADTSVALACERAFLAVLDGSCRTPIAGHAVLRRRCDLSFRGMILRPDGSEAFETSRAGSRARCGRARRGRGRGAEAPRAGRFLRGVTCACSSRGRNPTRRAPRRRCARAGTRCWSRRCCASQTIEADFGGPFDAVLMTSANAARAVAAHPRAANSRGFRAFTVGDRSAEAARAAGFARRRVGRRRARRSGAARVAARIAGRARAALSRGRGPRGRSRRRTRAPRHRGRHRR